MTDIFGLKDIVWELASDCCAGFIGGTVGVLVGHPFDTIKARLQTQQPGGHYRGTLHCFKEIRKQESISALYKGVSSPMVGLAVINGAVFASYKFSLGYFSSKYGNNGLSHFLAGVSAGSIQSLVTSPMELAKLRLQLQGEGIMSRHLFFRIDPPLRYSGPFNCLRSIIRTEGFRGVFRGWPVTLLRDAPCFGIYFWSYEWLLRFWSPKGLGHASLTDNFLAGGIAGMMSWLFLYPIDVIKSRYQADDRSLYSSSRNCALKSYRSGGWRLFCHGLAPTLIRAFLTNAATFFAVELFCMKCAKGYFLRTVENGPSTDLEVNRQSTDVDLSSSAAGYEIVKTADDDAIGGGGDDVIAPFAKERYRLVENTFVGRGDEFARRDAIGGTADAHWLELFQKDDVIFQNLIHRRVITRRRGDADDTTPERSQ